MSRWSGRSLGWKSEVLLAWRRILEPCSRKSRNISFRRIQWNRRQFWWWRRQCRWTCHWSNDSRISRSANGSRDGPVQEIPECTKAPWTAVNFIASPVISLPLQHSVKSLIHHRVSFLPPKKKRIGRRRINACSPCWWEIRFLERKNSICLVNCCKPSHVFAKMRFSEEMVERRSQEWTAWNALCAFTSDADEFPTILRRNPMVLCSRRLPAWRNLFTTLLLFPWHVARRCVTKRSLWRNSICYYSVGRSTRTTGESINNRSPFW